MTRNVTTSFRRSAEASFADEVDLCFLTISHNTFADDIRVVWDTQDYLVGSNFFIGFPFDINILSDDENPPTAQLAIQNVDPRIGDSIRALTSPPRIKIELMSSAEFSSLSSLLLHFNGNDASTTIIDSSGNGNTFTVNGAAQIDTAQSKFGSGSLLLNGSNAYVHVNANALLAFAAGDFTISLQFRLPSIGNYCFYCTNTNQLQIRVVAATTGSAIQDESSSNILDEASQSITDGLQAHVTVVQVSTTVIVGATAIATDTWYNVEVTRGSGTLRLFVDGIQNGSDFSDATNYTDNQVNIGASFVPDSFVNGWMDEVAVFKGYASDTDNFIPPQSAFASNIAFAPTITYSADKLFLINVSVDIMQITGTIVGWDYLQRVWPGPRALQVTFPGLFA